MRLNLCARNTDSLVKYVPFKTEKIETNFIKPNLIEEVNQLSKKEKKELKKTIIKFVATATSFLTLIIPTISLAAPLEIITDVPTMADIPSEATVSKDVLKALYWILTVSVSIGAAQGFVFFVMSAMIRTIPNQKAQKFALEWNKAIIRGTTQLIIAIPLLFLLWKVGSILLKNSGLFISPF